MLYILNNSFRKRISERKTNEIKDSCIHESSGYSCVHIFNPVKPNTVGYWCCWLYFRFSGHTFSVGCSSKLFVKTICQFVDFFQSV